MNFVVIVLSNTNELDLSWFKNPKNYLLILLVIILILCVLNIDVTNKYNNLIDLYTNCTNKVITYGVFT